MTTFEIVQFTLDALPYLLIGVATFLAVGAKARLDEITYLLWVIIFMLVVLVDRMVK